LLGVEVLRRTGRRLAGLLLLVLVTALNAAPTFDVGSSNEQFVSSSPGGHIGNYSAYSLISSSEQSTSLASVATEFLAPPVVKTPYVTATVSLPAVPKAILMVLTGFLCISLVRNRRTWLATLAALVWVGQLGLANLPLLASHICCKKQNEHFCSSDLVELEVASYLHSSDYVQHRNILLTQPAIILQKYFPCLFIKIVTNVVQQSTCFSPGFIFAFLARGPPKLA
jgi:hypothetical protein